MMGVKASDEANEKPVTTVAKTFLWADMAGERSGIVMGIIQSPFFEKIAQIQEFCKL
jgi:hypothetical protein